MNKTVLEILVDKKNEKWPWVFEHVLVVLHKAFENFDTKNIFGKTKSSGVNFSFEITKIGNRIRFFLISPSEYTNFLKNQVYAHFNDVEIYEVGDYFEQVPNDKLFVSQLKLKKFFLYPIKTFTELQELGSKESVDPYGSLTSALGQTGKYALNTFQVNFAPATDHIWKRRAFKQIQVLVSKYPRFLKNLMLSPNYIYLQILLFPFVAIMKLLSFFMKSGTPDIASPVQPEDWEQEMAAKILSEAEIDDLDEEKAAKIPAYFLNKIAKAGYKTSINIIHAGEDAVEARGSIKEIISTLWIYAGFSSNSFISKGISRDSWLIAKIKDRRVDDGFILNVSELAGLVHLPTNYVKTPQINWVTSRAFEPPSNLPIVDPDLTDNIVPETDLTPIGKTNFRGTDMTFGIGPDDRARHLYVIGKTGMGKSTLLENMIIDDIRKGRWVAVIDPHGDLAEAVIGFIPKSRTNQTIIFDPSDTEWPIAFNMLDNIKVEHRPLVASGLVGIFKKIFGDSWGPRLEHILRNIILALLEYPNTTLISIPLMLTSEVYRNKVVKKITDPVVRNFWTQEYAKMAPNQKVEAAGPILNKVGQFLSSTILRNVLGQPKNSFDMRWAMDNKKIIIVNLSKGKIGEDASALLGAMMVTKFQMDAMSRADIPENKREPFYLYVDEFQNFATDSFATILSEARKYKLNLVMANQYIDQMQEEVKWAVFGNVGSLTAFQVGYHDATILKEVFGADVTEEDLMNVRKYHIYTKQLIDGMPSPIFSAATIAPHKKQDEVFAARYDKILKVSREKYSKPRKDVVARINKSLEDIEKQEKEWGKKKEEFKNKKDADKKAIHEAKMKAQQVEKEKREAEAS